MRSASEQSSTLVVERVEDGGEKDKEKKKNKRRSTRRSKQNSPNTASSSMNETRGEMLQSTGDGKTKSYLTSMDHTSSRQPDFESHALSEQGMTCASNVAFNSMPAMRINEQTEHPLPLDLGGQVFSNSCPQPIHGGVPFGASKEKNLIPFYQVNGNARGNFFAAYWSAQAVEEALEKGDAYKALFRVNAHNRLEAYCKIEGVPTDILINGIAAQNRAVEGDTVVIKIDPLTLWTKMKGSNGPSVNFASAEDNSLAIDASDTAGSSCKGQSKVEVDDEYNELGGLPLQKAIQFEEGSCATEAAHGGLSSQVAHNFVNGCHPSASDSSHCGSSTGQNEVENGVHRLCTMVRCYPSKRPTGMVVAIVETSPRRDAIVGFLNVKQWLYYKEGYKKDMKKNKNSSLISSREYIQLTPTDPKFPKMMVPVRSLPDFIKKRLEGGDETVEMELVAVQIDSWDEENPFPQAHVLRVFGRGSEMESRLSAILYENAICCSDFSSESLSCLPCNTWQVPAEELKSRRDIRRLCTFTIDPSTATDLDDALSVERLPNGTVRVGVHIADVSYFVLPDTALDIEARLRSTSVYMLRGKLPMLPPLLSENMGSLNPGVDRLAFSIFWDLSTAGDVIDRWIGRTVMRSCCKLSYEQAQHMVDGKISEEACNVLEISLPQLHGPFKWSDVITSIKCLHEISKNLREKRFKNGAIQLESSKLSFLFDEYGVPFDSMICERRDSNFLVEEFMLLANRTAAEIISRAFPDSALLRRHPEPNLRKLRDFEGFCSKHGLALDASSSGNFYLSLECMKEKLKDDSVLIDILMSYATRPMQLATYFCSGSMKDNINEWGHYALAVPVYTHFTSPLRRYPDVVVHRTLTAAIEAEECLRSKRMPDKLKIGQQVTRCFTGLSFDKDGAESIEGREALSAAALKHGVACTESLADVAAYCNERKLASRHVKDGCDKLYMWVLLKNKEVIFTEARVLGLGPRFMSIYIQNLAIERRIYYDEVEGLTAEWLEATSTLVLNLCAYRRTTRRGGPGYYRALSEVAYMINPCDTVGDDNECNTDNLDNCGISSEKVDSEIAPLVFPITLRLLSTIPVVLHAVGGDDGPIDIGVRLFASSYLN
ncbi:DIS3-like exonuclease 2 isoform X2 [Euphorbia lathyris]|uniref:DIS3-like exonuclease 2 isoform X2 n=1 Tax=Euphorbia lathyris TaxID=212925 RepID=UPI0033142462